MKAVIMAGGKGTRLRPLTCQLPKPMVPLLNRPCMEYIIELLKSHGITQIAVTMQFLPEAIRDYFGDGSEFGVELHYFEEVSPLGTVGSVKNAQSFLDERFIVISGDALTDIDLTRAIRFHERREALATIVLARVEHPLEYGVVMTDDAGKITRFLEKPDWSEVFSDTVNTGIYVLEPEVLDRVASGKEQDFSNDLFPGMLRRGEPLYGVVGEGYWSDIGSLVQYRQSQFDMLEGRVKVEIKARELIPGVFIGENVTLPESGFNCSGPVFIGEGSVVEDKAAVGPYCVIGRGNRIASGSSVRQAVLWDNNTISENNEITGAMLCGGIRSYPGTVIGDGAVIGSHCTLGPKTHVLPKVKIWPRKKVHEHAVINRSIIWGGNETKALFADGAVSGLANEEITPEFAAKFAAAYGASLAKGKRLAVSSSPDGFGCLIRSIVIPSLQAAGVRVTDAGESTSSVARYAVGHLDVDGGIHIQSAESGGRVVCRLECMDEAGLPIGKSAERKVDNAFVQEDFPHSAIAGIAQVRRVEGMIESYGKRLIAEADIRVRTPIRAVALAEDLVVRRIMDRMADAYMWELLDAGPAAGDIGMTSAVIESGAAFGVCLEAGGQSIRLFDETGAPVPAEQASVLFLLSYLECFSGRTIGVPLSDPTFLDSAAESLGNRVVRTKRSARSVLEMSKGNTFHPSYDALFALGLLVRRLTESGQTISGLLQGLPAFSLHRMSVEVPWDEKGRLMRRLTEHAKDRHAELLDGIKLYEETGWVLLLPEAHEPLFTVIAHGDRPESARELAERYTQQWIRPHQSGGVSVEDHSHRFEANRLRRI